MENLILKLMGTMFKWFKSHKRCAIEAVLSFVLALSVLYGITLRNTNKSLTQSLEQAQTNIEAYQEIINDNNTACTVLRMTNEQLEHTKDSVLIKLNQMMEKNKVKKSSLLNAATQTQSIDVSASKGVGGYIEVLKDTIYTDSLKYNDLTKVYYSIGNDSINIRLDLSNTQYLYTYKTKEYKNKKNFFKRLFTLDFKKVTKYKYDIVNTNDLLKTSDVRIIEIEQ